MADEIVTGYVYNEAGQRFIVGGPPGVGVPPAGVTDDILTKESDTENYVTGWRKPPELQIGAGLDGDSGPLVGNGSSSIWVDAGDAIDTANGVSVKVDGTTIEVAADALQVKDGGITAAKLNVPIDALSDVDTTTVVPADKEILQWDDVAKLWKPATNAAATGAYLPLDGSVPMDPLATIDFRNELGPKVNLYSDTFGLGIASGSNVYYASSYHRFRIGTQTGEDGTISGTEVALIGSNTLQIDGRNVPRIKVITKDVVAGTWYRIAGDYGAYTSVAVRWAFGVNDNTDMQAAAGVAVYGNTGGHPYSGAAQSVYQGTKTFDAIGCVFSGGPVLAIKAARTGTVRVGIELGKMTAGDGYGVWDMAAVSGTIYGTPTPL